MQLPVQSGSDRILAAMKRGYTHDWYLDRIKKLREVRPDIAVATDFIVGFPGETEEDFEETMRLIEEVGFDASFSFVYSKRPGTPAADLPADTPQEVKAAAASAGRQQRQGRRFVPCDAGEFGTMSRDRRSPPRRGGSRCPYGQ